MNRARLVSSEFFHWTRWILDTCPNLTVSSEKIHWTEALPLFFFGHLDIRVLKGGQAEQIMVEKTLYFPFFNGSLNSLLGLGVMFLLYGMNIQCDCLQDFINDIFDCSLRFLFMYQFFHAFNKFNHVFFIIQMNF